MCIVAPFLCQMPWQSLLHCWVSKAGRLTFSLQNQATFKFRCLLVFVAYCDTGRGKGLALWPSLFTRHSVVVNLWNVCRDGFQREINFLIFFFVGCMRQRVFQPDLQETSRSSHCSEACLGPSCKMPDAGCGFSTRTVWHFLAMFPFFCLACCLTGIAPWHSGFAHWLWKCLKLCPDVLHSQELWAQILDPESCQQLASDTHFSCLIWPTCTWNATSCSWLCISIIIVQLTELFCRYSSSRLWQRSPSLAAVSFHILPFLGRPDMFDACFFDPFDCFDWHLDAIELATWWSLLQHLCSAQAVLGSQWSWRWWKLWRSQLRWNHLKRDLAKLSWDVPFTMHTTVLEFHSWVSQEKHWYTELAWCFAAKVEEVQNSVQAAKTLMDWLRCLAVTVSLVL